MEEADRYFLRRRQQFEATMSARPYKITTGLRPLSAPARDPATGEASSLQAKIQKMQCVGPETFPSPFLKEVAKGSPVAEEFAKMFTQACNPLTLRIPCLLKHVLK